VSVRRTWTNLAPIPHMLMRSSTRRAVKETRQNWLGNDGTGSCCVREPELGLKKMVRLRRYAASARQPSPVGGLAHSTSARHRRADPAEARRRRAKAGWEAGIRTPITWSRATCPTVERPPSVERIARRGTFSLAEAREYGQALSPPNNNVLKAQSNMAIMAM
jgi:hypothetical protein